MVVAGGLFYRGCLPLSQEIVTLFYETEDEKLYLMRRSRIIMVILIFNDIYHLCIIRIPSFQTNRLLKKTVNLRIIQYILNSELWHFGFQLLISCWHKVAVEYRQIMNLYENFWDVIYFRNIILHSFRSFVHFTLEPLNKRCFVRCNICPVFLYWSSKSVWKPIFFRKKKKQF